ncbi:MerR HTH family regulatory protein [Daejeonella rubra]|uniref:MerR HTH family regulatory protein n=1 Tax=Daejeonella rubra TaxID=990371 RepID=A0A1G9UCE3_9SPHI|nr:MerR family transcriptional regulator [Daejeonella rubra]SDM57374.1 MerR HTH family regulatory protein [Daejeonella rubra]
MNLFSISQLSQFSGIKPHTIRVWEQRYNALKPNRSDGNTRYYDDYQLRRLLNIVSLMDNGHKVSTLCSMTDDDLFFLVSNSNTPRISESTEYYISQLIAAGISYDAGYFEIIFSDCFLKFGMKDAYMKVIYPMMERIGLMWATNSLPTAHEHFISNIVRQKLLAVLDSIVAPDPASESWLLFLPENEFHEIGLLYAHLIIRLSGKKVIYLGSNLPVESVISAIHDIKPENLLLFLVHYDLPEQIQKSLDKFYESFNGNKIYLAGNDKLISQLNLNRNTEYLHSIESLEEVLNSGAKLKTNTTI